MDKVVRNEKVLVEGDFNGNIGYDIGGLEKVHGGFGIEQDEDGGVRVIDWVMFDEYVSRKGNVDI